MSKKNLRSTTKSTNTPITQAPVTQKNINKKSTKITEKNIDQSPNQTPTSSKRKHSVSPTSPDIAHSAKKSTTVMANKEFSMEQLEKMFSDHANNIAINFQAQFATHSEAVSKEIKMQLDNHTVTVQNEIKKQLDLHANSVQNQIKVLGDNLKSELNGHIDDVNKKIDTFQSNFNDHLVTLQKNVDGCMDRVNLSEDDVRRNMKLNELKIKGIPYTQDESLQELFENISKFIGYDVNGPNHMPQLNRIQKKNKAANESVPLPFIIVKFVAKPIRDKFYSLYLSKVSKKQLKTEDINLSQGGHVIISENLTSINQQLFIQAMKLKFDKKLIKVYTKDGLVQAKKTIESKPKTIRVSRDLDLIAAVASTSFETTTTTQSLTPANIPSALPASSNGSITTNI